MRILDKYLLREFAWPLLYCFDAFVLLMIVIDLFGTLDEFIDFHARLGTVVHYYLILLPEMFVLIMPMSLLLGLLFCLSNLGRHNELIAMRTSGISLARLALPLLGSGLAATLVVFVVNELFVPRARERADALMGALKGKGERSVLENFFFADPIERRDWYARRFNTRTFEMENPEVHDRKPDGTPDFDVYAERARWIDGRWHFFTADVYDHRQNPPVVTRVAETNFPSIKDPPGRLAVEGKNPTQLTSAELRRYIRAQRRAGHVAGLAKYEVTYQYRYAFPLTCLIVVLMGIPLGMQVSRSGPLLSVGTALVLVVAFYFLNNITLALGEGGRIPAAAAAWMTNAVFAGVGLVLLARAR
ncbi:MAG TPA: LptF/LptG family permease [Verrucomicrobiae bacterium]|nr:LptF/LptG family permease [Verrucomicrobiae bacterium]